MNCSMQMSNARLWRQNLASPSGVAAPSEIICRSMKEREERGFQCGPILASYTVGGEGNNVAGKQ
jgi:hypothetical protein